MTANINTNTGLKEVQVLAIFKIMGYVFFVHANDWGGLSVSEWLSGLALPCIRDDIEEVVTAIAMAKAFLEDKGQDKIDDVIMRGRLEWGQANLSSEAQP
jgi:hypothetical protein